MLRCNVVDISIILGSLNIQQVLQKLSNSRERLKQTHYIADAKKNNDHNHRQFPCAIEKLLINPSLKAVYICKRGDNP